MHRMDSSCHTWDSIITFSFRLLFINDLTQLGAILNKFFCFNLHGVAHEFFRLETFTRDWTFRVLNWRHTMTSVQCSYRWPNTRLAEPRTNYGQSLLITNHRLTKVNRRENSTPHNRTLVLCTLLRVTIFLYTPLNTENITGKNILLCRTDAQWVSSISPVMPTGLWITYSNRRGTT